MLIDVEVSFVNFKIFKLKDSMRNQKPNSINNFLGGGGVASTPILEPDRQFSYNNQPQPQRYVPPSKFANEVLTNQFKKQQLNDQFDGGSANASPNQAQKVIILKKSHFKHFNP